MKKFVVRSRESGDAIEYVDTLEQAQEILNQFEKNDKEEGIYEKDFYEIYDTEKEEIIL